MELLADDAAGVEIAGEKADAETRLCIGGVALPVVDSRSARVRRAEACGTSTRHTRRVLRRQTECAICGELA